MSSGAGHNLSQGDLESDGDSEKNPANTGTGCYKNYDHYPLHHRRSNTSNQVDFIPIFNVLKFAKIFDQIFHFFTLLKISANVNA